MKANEFVKKYGISRAKQILKYSDKNHRYFIADGISTTYSKYSDGFYSLKDLEQIIEAHEIIGLFKSLDHAKAEAQACEQSKHSEILVKLNAGVGYIWLSRVKQAIKDVESCQ